MCVSSLLEVPCYMEMLVIGCKWPSRQLIKRKIVCHTGELLGTSYRNLKVKMSCLVRSFADLCCGSGESANTHLSKNNQRLGKICS